MIEHDADWPRNYFNYFTEIEEHFQRARGTGLFLLSPLDWALIESWKNGGVPLIAVLRGIDIAFEKWRAKKSRTQMVNGLAFCAQAVMRETEIIAKVGTDQPRPEKTSEPLFAPGEIRAYLNGNAAKLCDAGQADLAASLDALDDTNLEDLEQHLTAIEQKLIARLMADQSDEDLVCARRELDHQLRPYRGKMSAPQLAMLERQYLERRLLDHAHLPRLSLFYMPH